MAPAAYAKERSLEFTPTWALATVSIIFILISFTVERLLHLLGHYLQHHKKKSLLLALQKLKDELMMMGFISLTITLFSNRVSNICVRSRIYDKLTPCDIKLRPDPPSPSSYCAEGYESFVSYNTLHQLHIFIFVLVVVHVAFSCITMALALTKVYSWNKWEREAQEAVARHRTAEFAKSVTYSRQSTFVRYHTSKPWGNRIIVWVVCFFQQFHVPRADYLTLRLSFVTNHNLRDNYDFHAYMIRCMTDEFETIVGISIWLWGFVVAFLIFTITEPEIHFYTSFIPLAVVLIIGTKLQHIVASLALEHSGVTGPFVGVLIKPRDQLFWFNRPKLLLHILHFILFESAFEFATFVWHVWQFEFKTCLAEDNYVHLYIRLAVGILTLLICCFSTLPLYSLVSQMSTMPKKAFLPKHVERCLRKWHEDAKHRLKLKVMEKYHSQRRMAALPPLDERYFLQPDLPGELLAISNGHARAATTPMAIIMEEGAASTNRIAETNHKMLMDAPSHPPNDQATGVSPAVNAKRKAELLHDHEEKQREHPNLLKPPVSYTELRRRAMSPTGASLHIPPFNQPPFNQPHFNHPQASANIPKPIQRLSSM